MSTAKIREALADMKRNGSMRAGRLADEALAEVDVIEEELTDLRREVEIATAKAAEAEDNFLLG